VPSVEQVLARLEAEGDPKNVAGMARFGIVGDAPFGVSMKFVRKLARDLGRDHALALGLWASGRHEARLLATLVDEPAKVTRAQMDRWARGLKSWDVCDACGMNLFEKTPHADAMIAKWARDERELVKRAAFSTMVGVVVHQKDAPRPRVLAYLPMIEAASDDDRNFVKKAVGWALRSIGKAGYRKEAVACARRIGKRGSKGARWVARDALRELETKPISRGRS